MTNRAQSVRLCWERMDRQSFERIVEAALHQKHADAQKVWSPEDSGGDGGRDVLVEYHDRRLIYQLKFYPDGLTSKPASRKQQIEASFKAALKHDPTHWILVFPSKINDAMGKSLTALPKRKSIWTSFPNAGNVNIEYLDRPRLDGLLAQHPDLLNMLERDDDYLLRSALTYGQEKAVLAGGLSDLVVRTRALGRQTADLDPHWKLAFSYDGSITTVQPVPKHPRAAQVSPISQKFAFGLPEDAHKLRDQARAILEFGGRGDLTIPGEFVQLGAYTGPEAFRLTGELHELVIMAQRGNPNVIGKPIRLVVLDEDQNYLADSQGRITYGGLGTAGHTMEFSLDGRVSLIFSAPFQEGGSVDLNIRQDSEHASPVDIRAGAGLIQAIGTAARIEVHLDGKKAYLLGALRTRFDETYLAEVDALRRAADDLAVIQQHLKQSFPMPAELQPVERLWLRALSIALEGGVAPIPREEIEFKLFDEVDADDLKEEHCALWVLPKGETMRLAGGHLRLPKLIIAHPRAHTLVDQKARTAVVKPPDGEVFVMYAPESLRDTSGYVTPVGCPRRPRASSPDPALQSGSLR